MGLTMREKQAVTRQLAVQYKQATKTQKGGILDTLTKLSGATTVPTLHGYYDNEQDTSSWPRASSKVSR